MACTSIQPGRLFQTRTNRIHTYTSPLTSLQHPAMRMTCHVITATLYGVQPTCQRQHYRTRNHAIQTKQQLGSGSSHSAFNMHVLFFCVLYHHADTPFFDLGRLISQLPTVTHQKKISRSRIGKRTPHIRSTKYAVTQRVSSSRQTGIQFLDI